MKLIHDSTLCLLHLLLLAELLVHSSSRPTHSSPLCGVFKSMISQVDRLANLSKNLHDLTDDELFDTVENKLDSLPDMQHTAAHFNAVTVNASLSLLFEYTQSFRQHVDWLKTAKENFSLPSQSAEGASAHLLQLSNLINASLHQISEEVPPSPSPSPSLPVVSTAFDVLRFSVEISKQLQVFCNWSKRVLLNLQRLSHCRRH